MTIKFKKDEEFRLSEEVFALHDLHNKPLYFMIKDIADFAWLTFKKDIVITCIGRTQEEQDSIYGYTNLVEKKKVSPHQLWQAFDLRSRTFTKTQRDILLNYINDKYNNDNGFLITAICHNVGRGDHFHVQFVPK